MTPNRTSAQTESLQSWRTTFGQKAWQKGIKRILRRPPQRRDDASCTQRSFARHIERMRNHPHVALLERHERRDKRFSWAEFLVQQSRSAFQAHIRNVSKPVEMRLEAFVDHCNIVAIVARIDHRAISLRPQKRRLGSVLFTDGTLEVQRFAL